MLSWWIFFCCLFISCVTVYEVSWFILNFYRFLHELAQIPNFAERAQCIIFRSVFSEGITALHRKVEIITRASKVCLLPNSRITLPFLGFLQLPLSFVSPLSLSFFGSKCKFSNWYFSPFSIISVDFIFLYFRVKTENQLQLQVDLCSCFLGHY